MRWISIGLLVTGCVVKRRVVDPGQVREQLAALDRTGRAVVVTRRLDQHDGTEHRELAIGQVVDVDGVAMPVAELTRGCLEGACRLDDAREITVERWRDLDGRWVAGVTAASLIAGLGVATWASDTSPSVPEDAYPIVVGTLLGIGAAAFWIRLVQEIADHDEG